MRLKEAQVKHVCQNVLQHLRSKHLITLKNSESEVLTKMEEIFIRDLKVEDQINLEAEKLLAQYERQMGANVDRQKMFQMIKKQLIKDKNVIV